MNSKRDGYMLQSRSAAGAVVVFDPPHDGLGETFRVGLEGEVL